MTQARENQGGSGWPYELAALLVAAAGVLVRCLPWRFIFSDEGVVPWGVDPYYHLWRAEQLAVNFPSLPQTDAFLAFPSGAPVPWPPLFDWLVSLPGLFGGDSQSIAAFGAVLMPILGGLAIYLTYRLGARLFDRACGLAAAGMLAFMRGAVEFNLLGRVDHHGLVAPVVLSMFLCFLACLRSESPRKRAIWGVACGLLTAVSIGAWVITPPYYFLPIPLVLIWLALTGEGHKFRPAALWIMAPVVVLAPLFVWLTGDLASRPMALHFPSLLTLLPYLLAAAGVTLAFLTPRLFLPVALILGLGAIVLVLAAPGVLPEPVGEVIRLLGGQNPIYLLAWESDSLFTHEGLLTLNRPVLMYTHLILLWPVILGVYLWRRGKDAASRPAGVLFGVFCLWGMGLLMLQERFGEYATPSFALLVGWGLVLGGQVVMKWLRQEWGLRRARRTGPLAAALLVVLGFALYPLVGSLVHLAGTDPVEYQRVLLRFGREFKKATPDPSGPDGLLNYGVLTGWNDANPLRWVAGRPVMVSSFSYPEVDANTKEAFEMLLGGDEEPIVEKMAISKIRYVVVSPHIKQAESMAITAGLSEPLVRRTSGQSDQGAFVLYTPLPAYGKCLRTRLWLGDGSRTQVAGMDLEGLSHFRFLLESPEQTALFGVRVPTLKAFEVVSGARLRGNAPAGETIRLRLQVVTNTGRSLPYRREVQADAQGRFEFRVPYASTPQRPYRIKIGQAVVHLQVADNAVRRGLPVDVPPPAATGTTEPSGPGRSPGPP